eukprot:m.278648 g.278648  ORF g.278648 m.278648 type:complete len:430 (-) comp16316_c1_seq9:66-1355(-)
MSCLTKSVKMARRKVLLAAVLLSCLVLGDKVVRGSEECVSSDVNIVTSRPHATKITSEIKAILHENFTFFDTEAEDMITAMRNIPGFMEFSHARDTFNQHLLGTFTILSAWKQSQDVLRTGLFHTGYSGDLFQFYVWDARKEVERDVLRGIVGDEAERLVWLFGTVHRGDIYGLKHVMNASSKTGVVMATSDPMDTITIPHRIEGELTISNYDAAKLILVTMADYLDQMVTVNAWRDHHQMETPAHLYPGDGRPEICMYWISAICNAAKIHMDIVPPVFDKCETVIRFEDEVTARDLYWKVVLMDKDTTLDTELKEQEQIDMLLSAVQHNPFIAEPHIQLSQIYFRQKHYSIAYEHACKAIDKLQTLATAWDKRLSFRAWLSYARMMAMRSKRREEGKDTSLPTTGNGIPPTSGGLPLVAIADLVDQMP